MASSHRDDVDRLRARIDEALRRERPRAEVRPLVQRLLDEAPEDREVQAFANRLMAELHIEDSPWQAALHLRRVLKLGVTSDSAHALMGLCQALLGNFDSAVVHYERAIAIQPGNAWYHHNLGHLLDVALDMPEAAASHLKAAHAAQPLEDEVTASLAHCLARLGHLDEAEALAREALDLDPDQGSHNSLLVWIRRGAPGGSLLSADERLRAKDPRATRASSDKKARDQTIDREVISALERGIEASGAPYVLLSRAELVWRDYRAQNPSARMGKPEVHAAALDYAVSLMHGMTGVTQSAVAKRYGVSSTAVSARYGELRATLSLEVGDPRYL